MKNQFSKVESDEGHTIRVRVQSGGQRAAVLVSTKQWAKEREAVRMAQAAMSDFISVFTFKFLKNAQVTEFKQYNRK